MIDNGEPEELLLLVSNFQITLEASGTISDGTNIQYLHMLVRGKALRQLDKLSVEVGSATSEHLKSTILGLVMYFFLLMRCQKKQCAT